MQDIIAVFSVRSRLPSGTQHLNCNNSISHQSHQPGFFYHQVYAKGVDCACDCRSS
ncbi:hypothetical protein SLEP1_g9266 [Rubroshorea leprosula]|uniref:Uncharacterized protein n=1 Tax=Rubroshorea leprosula TaxID=152421 RepID=A0AAV5IFL1_9ROSI|nr:hypothetical protein SLEP1_g9266 [Rubroshorea leprosula]